MEELKPCPYCESFESGDFEDEDGKFKKFNFCPICGKPFNEAGKKILAARRTASKNKALTAQWISAKDKLPEIGQRVAVKCNELYHGMFDVLCYCPDYKPWKTNGVAWWTPIPELPEDARKPEKSEKP